MTTLYEWYTANQEIPGNQRQPFESKILAMTEIEVQQLDIDVAGSIKNWFAILDQERKRREAEYS